MEKVDLIREMYDVETFKVDMKEAYIKDHGEDEWYKNFSYAVAMMDDLLRTGHKAADENKLDRLTDQQFRRFALYKVLHDFLDETDLENIKTEDEIKFLTAFATADLSLDVILNDK